MYPNHAWFAAVENLRQLKLFKQSLETQLLFRRRCPELDLPERLPVTAVVLAPPSFYVANGRRAEAVAPAERLLGRMRDEAGSRRPACDMGVGRAGHHAFDSCRQSARTAVLTIDVSTAVRSTRCTGSASLKRATIRRHS